MKMKRILQAIIDYAIVAAAFALVLAASLASFIDGHAW
jgi:hypothetical protein